MRDDDGLALSSRNVRSASALARQALGAVARAACVGDDDAPVRERDARAMRAVMDDAGVDVAYADVVDPRHVRARRDDDERGERARWWRAIVDGVRLIDNGPVTWSRRVLMLLAMDVGNTETVIGLFGPRPPEAPDAMGFARASGEHGLAYHWRISTVADRTPDEHAMVLTQLLDLEGLDLRTAVTRDGDLARRRRRSPRSCVAWRTAGSRTST